LFNKEYPLSIKLLFCIIVKFPFIPVGFEANMLFKFVPALNIFGVLIVPVNVAPLKSAFPLPPPMDPIMVFKFVPPL